jgi:uncharacterized protein (TIGR00369 family)
MNPLEQMATQLSSLNGKLKIPPPVFIEMGGEIVSLNAQTQTATVRFPVEERYQNPIGYIQGGIIAAMIDNAVGPLSFLVAPPSVTKSMMLEFIKPITPDMQMVTINASVESLAGRKLFLLAEVFSEDNTLLARGRALQIILTEHS